MCAHRSLKGEGEHRGWPSPARGASVSTYLSVPHGVSQGEALGDGFEALEATAEGDGSWRPLGGVAVFGVKRRFLKRYHLD